MSFRAGDLLWNRTNTRYARRGLLRRRISRRAGQVWQTQGRQSRLAANLLQSLEFICGQNWRRRIGGSGFDASDALGVGGMRAQDVARTAVRTALSAAPGFAAGTAHHAAEKSGHGLRIDAGFAHAVKGIGVRLPFGAAGVGELSEDDARVAQRAGRTGEDHLYQSPEADVTHQSGFGIKGGDVSGFVADNASEFFGVGCLLDDGAGEDYAFARQCECVDETPIENRDVRGRNRPFGQNPQHKFFKSCTARGIGADLAHRQRAHDILAKNRAGALWHCAGDSPGGRKVERERERDKAGDGGAYAQPRLRNSPAFVAQAQMRRDACEFDDEDRIVDAEGGVIAVAAEEHDMPRAGD